MEENLLTILAYRYGRQGCSPQTDSEGTFEDGPKSIGLINCSAHSCRSARDQAVNLGLMVIRSGRDAHLFSCEPTSHSDRGKWFGRPLQKLIQTVKASELVHLITGSYLDLWLRGCLIVVIARFFGKRVILELTGSWMANPKGWQLRLLSSWVGLCQTVLVQSGQSDLWSQKLGVEVGESKPVIDLEAIEGRQIREVQPMIVADCFGRTKEEIGELISGFEIVKQKYPRTELMLWLNQARTIADLARSRFGSLPGLSFKNVESDGGCEDSLKQSDVYVCCRTEPMAESNLLLAAASGNIIMTGQSSGLTTYLRQECHFDPITFSSRSTLAHELIYLIEKPLRAKQFSAKSRGLAEQFALDNLTASWFSKYAQAHSG